MQQIRPRLPDLPDSDDDEVPNVRARHGGSVAAGERFELDLGVDDDESRQPASAPVLISDIKERPAAGAPKSPGPPAKDLPARKESRFKTALRQKQQQAEATEAAPSSSKSNAVGSTPAETPPAPAPASGASLHDEIDAENKQVLESVTEAEVLEEQTRLMEMLGPDMVQFIRNRGQGQGQPAAPPTPAKPLKGRRSVRFNDAVSYSNPPSRSPSPPHRRVPIILPSSDDPTIGNWLQDEAARVKPGDREQMVEEGTPEDIRRRFFPDEPMSASLDWTGENGTAAPATDKASAIRFTAQGRAIEQEVGYIDHSSELDRHAGPSETFSLAELAQLAMSAVPGQRTLALQIIQKVLSGNLEAPTQAGVKLRISETVNAIFAVCVRGLLDRHVAVVALCIGIMRSYAVLEDTNANAAAAVLTAQPPPLQSLAKLLSPKLSPVELPETAKVAILNTLLALVDAQQDFVSTEYIEARLLLDSVVVTFLQVSWPPVDGQLPQADAARLLVLLISRSRSNAEQIWARRLEHPTLRFLAVPPWQIEASAQPTAFAVTAATLRIFSEYANYGLACSTYSSSTSLFRQIQDWIAEHPADDENLTQSWFDLLESWSLCAIDPHSTTPEHDILWAETKEWGEHCVDVLAQQGLSLATYNIVLRALAAWLRGSQKHDTTSYGSVLQSLDEDTLERLVTMSSSEPIDESKARLLLSMRQLLKIVGEGRQWGLWATTLERVQVEHKAAIESDDTEWT